MNDPTTWNPAYGLTMKNLAAALPLAGAIIIFFCFKFIYDLDNKKLDEIEKALGRQRKDVTVTVSSALSATTNSEE